MFIILIVTDLPLHNCFENKVGKSWIWILSAFNHTNVFFTCISSLFYDHSFAYSCIFSYQNCLLVVFAKMNVHAISWAFLLNIYSHLNNCLQFEFWYSCKFGCPYLTRWVDPQKVVTLNVECLPVDVGGGSHNHGYCFYTTDCSCKFGCSLYKTFQKQKNSQ